MSSTVSTSAADEGARWSDLSVGDRIRVEYESAQPGASRKVVEGTVGALDSLTVALDLDDGRRFVVEFPDGLSTQVWVHTIASHEFGDSQQRISSAAPSGCVQLCENVEPGAGPAADPAAEADSSGFGEPIRLDWQNSTRRRVHEACEDRDDDDARLVCEAFERQKTSVLIKRVEEAEALRRVLPEFKHDRRAWANAMALHALVRMIDNLDEELAERGMEPRTNDAGEFVEYVEQTPEPEPRRRVSSWDTTRNA